MVIIRKLKFMMAPMTMMTLKCRSMSPMTDPMQDLRTCIF